MTPHERKMLVLKHRVRLGDVAAEVGCSQAVVSRVLHGLTRRETPFSRDVRASIAVRVGRSVDEFWSEAA